jgi:hypothetical protein
MLAGFTAGQGYAGYGASDGAWLDGEAAGAIACDAAMAPIVTGEVNVDALQDLVRLCVELDARRDDARDAAWAALEQAVIGKAVGLLSGPGGLASFLRHRQLGARLSGPSLPLDIGYSETIPAGIRNAVMPRDRHCQWAGGCHQPAGACEVHHTKHKANGGKTSVRTACCCARSTTRSSSTGGAGPLSSTRTGPPRRGTRTRPRCSTATGHPPAPGNSPGTSPRAIHSPLLARSGDP